MRATCSTRFLLSFCSLWFVSILYVYSTATDPSKRFSRYAQVGSNHKQRDPVIQMRIEPDELPVSFFSLMTDHHIDPFTAAATVIGNNFCMKRFEIGDVPH